MMPRFVFARALLLPAADQAFAPLRFLGLIRRVAFQIGAPRMALDEAELA